MRLVRNAVYTGGNMQSQELACSHHPGAGTKQKTTTGTFTKTVHGHERTD